MTLGPIKPGDIVEVEKRGVTFFAKVEGKPGGGVVTLRPFEKWVTYRECRSREIVGHYRKSKATLERERG
jgi:hypothetical protein